MKCTRKLQLMSVLTLLPLSATAQNTHVYQASSGASKASAHNYASFVAASQSTNNTRSVTFPGLSGETWTWRTNVSNVPVPDAVQPFPGEQPPLVDPAFTHLTYDFQWPGDEILNEKLNSSSSSINQGQSQDVCLTVLNVDLPSRLANKYEESDNGDCSNVLGEDCVSAFLAAMTRSNGCLSPSGLSVDECSDTLQAKGVGAGGTTFQLGNGTSPSGNSTDGFGNPYNETESGQAVYYRDGGLNFRATAVNGTNTTVFDAELSRVQVIALTGLAGQNRLMCMRVDVDHTSAGHALKASMTNVLLAVGLATITAVLTLL